VEELLRLPAQRGTRDAHSSTEQAKEGGMSGIEKIAIGLFLAGTVLFFLWVAALTIRK
jgi:hypothetical protein